jgi:hypothetical protein
VAASVNYFFVALRSAPTEIRVFDHAGSFVRILGRSGSGPGEFRSVRALHVGKGDSLFVADDYLLRLSVFDPSMRFVRNVPLKESVFEQGLVVLDSMVVLNVDASTIAADGAPLHGLTKDGRSISRFGRTPAPSGSVEYNPLTMVRWLAPSTSGTLWAAKLTVYSVERWSMNGKLIEELQRSPPWFQTNTDPKYPATQVIAVQEDTTSQLLWVVGRVADPNWRASIRQGTGEQGWRVADRTGYYDLVVDVIDLRTYDVLATQGCAEFGAAFIGPGRIVTYRETTAGIPQLDVWQLTLYRTASAAQRGGESCKVPTK